jgi:hypothetical protein
MFIVQNDASPANTGTITGGWGGTALNLTVDGVAYLNTTLSFELMTYTGSFSNGILDPGEFDFIWGGNLLFKVAFDHARVNIGGLAGDNIFSNNGVEFSGPAVASFGTLTNESFSFSFANQAPIEDGFTSSAAFTSSAIPEPATIFVLALGSVFVVVRRGR